MANMKTATRINASSSDTAAGVIADGSLPCFLYVIIHLIAISRFLCFHRGINLHLPNVLAEECVHRVYRKWIIFTIPSLTSFSLFHRKSASQKAHFALTFRNVRFMF